MKRSLIKISLRTTYERGMSSNRCVVSVVEAVDGLMEDGRTVIIEQSYTPAPPEKMTRYGMNSINAQPETCPARPKFRKLIIGGVCQDITVDGGGLKHV